MSLQDPVWSTGSFTQLAGFPFFFKYPLLRDIVIATSFLIFSDKVFVNQVFSSLCDGMPVRNQRNIKEHVSVVCQTSGTAAQGGMYSCSHGVHGNG